MVMMTIYDDDDDEVSAYLLVRDDRVAQGAIGHPPERKNPPVDKKNPSESNHFKTDPSVSLFSLLVALVCLASSSSSFSPGKVRLKNNRMVCRDYKSKVVDIFPDKAL